MKSQKSTNSKSQPSQKKKAPAKKRKPTSQSRKKRSTNRSANQKAPARWWWRLLKLGLWISLFAALAIIGYLIYLDRNITSTFEGRRWSIPAQVFAQPLELYPGARIDRTALTQELARLGYRVDVNLAISGTYKHRGQDLQIHLRPFRFMERERRAQRIELKFARGRVNQINGPGGEIPLIRLDPATIGSFFPSHGEDRLILTPGEVPDLLREGLKAIEDRAYDEHLGFSVRGILRAVMVNLREGTRAQGGSTLTQQLVKSYFLTNRRTFERKLQEVAMAFILELRFSKEDLLTAYINEIFLGQNGNRAIHGFGLGAQFYFNKRLQELNPEEIATLIAIIRGPSFYNPFRHPERALERRDRILNTFHNDGLLDEQQLETALAKPLNVMATPTSGGAYYPAFMDQVRAELTREYDLERLSSEGLTIFTTIQPRLQEQVQAAVSGTLNSLESTRDMDSGSLQSAAIVADSQTGEIQALVGGRKGRVDGFNRALNAERPVGSLLKPVVYLSAVESGMHLAQTIVDEPIELTPEHGETWQPKNFDGEFRGELPLVRALAQSLNLTTVHLGLQLGLSTIQDRFAKLTNQTPKNRYPSLLLGAESLAPIKVLELYGNFASGGFRTPPKAVIAVLDSEGRALTHRPFELEQTIAPEHAATINRALEIVMAKGTGRSSPFSQAGVAGKTGTSNDNRDSWFAGFDNRRVSVVWVGRDDNKITGLTGSSGALRIWNQFTRSISVEPLIHTYAENLVEVEFETGLLANAKCAEVVRIPVPDPSQLNIKSGCNISRSLGERFRRWLR